jgi:hemolysin activation/secretion protein
MTRPCRVFLALMLTSALNAQVLAQAVPEVRAPTREEIDRDALRPTGTPTTRLTVAGEIERAPCPLADPIYQDITFTLREAQFAQLQGASPESLRPAFAEFIGQTVPLSTVCEIRDRAATILRQQGYLAAVQVPPQEIQDGIVRFDVLMAKVVRVQVRGDAGRSEGTIAGFLRRLSEMPVFNEREAERYLLLARDLPGYDLRLTLRPAGTQPGEVIGEVAVIHRPIDVDLNIQNYGSNAVGRFGGLLRAQFNGLTGLGDRTTIGVFSTADFDEQQVVQIFHDFALGSDGLRLGGRFTYAWTEPGGEPDLGLKSRTLLGTIEAVYPFVRSLDTNIYGVAGLDIVDQEIDILDTTTNRDKLRVAYVRAEFDQIDRQSVAGFGGYSISTPRLRSSASIELRQGLDILDATEFCALCPVQPSRFPADATGTVLRGAASLEYRTTPDVSFWVSTRAQYSDDPLLAFEEYSGGNYTVGRGYDPGIIIGDSGIGVQGELRLGRLNPSSATSFAFQPYAFVDAARVWNNQDGFPGSQSLASAGGGVRAAYGDRARLDLTLAVPLKRAGFQTDRGDPRLLLTFTTRLAPWSR